MAIEVIDGTVAAATLKRSGGKVAIYETMSFYAADGTERRLNMVAVAPDVAVTPVGRRGSFLLL